MHSACLCENCQKTFKLAEEIAAILPDGSRPDVLLAALAMVQGDIIAQCAPNLSEAMAQAKDGHDRLVNFILRCHQTQGVPPCDPSHVTMTVQ